MTSPTPQDLTAEQRFKALQSTMAEVTQLTATMEAVREQLNRTTSAVRIAAIGAIPPRMLLNDMEKQRKQHEEEALARAADGTGPQPFDRDWTMKGYDFHELLASEQIGWHQSNELLTILAWAANSPQGHQALSWEGDPDLNPHQHTVELYRELEAALINGAMVDLCEQADRLGFDSDLIRNR